MNRLDLNQTTCKRKGDSIMDRRNNSLNIHKRNKNKKLIEAKFCGKKFLFDND